MGELVELERGLNLKDPRSPLNVSGSLLERKRLQLGFLPPPTAEILGGTAVDIFSPDDNRDRYISASTEPDDEIETPPYNPYSQEFDLSEECSTDKFSISVYSSGPPPVESLLPKFERSSTPLATTVGFCDQVSVHFYLSDFSPATSISSYIGHVKTFDGRSACDRGVLFEDCIEMYLDKMSCCRQNICYDFEDDDFSDEDDEQMDRDILFCCNDQEELSYRRRRPRFYAADETSLAAFDSMSGDLDPTGGSLLSTMENTPCDCDLLLVG